MSQHKTTSVVFLGTSAFAVPYLRLLEANDAFNVQLIITQPDRPVGRKQVVTPSAVKIAALELGLTVAQPEKINADIKAIKGDIPAPDYLVVVSYGQILSEEILRWPTIVAVNVHASLLPLLRGASPLQHTILQGLTETGVTVQRMVKELDAGPILAQRHFSVGAYETFTSLHDSLAELGATLLIETLTLLPKEQKQDHTKATFCKKLTRSNGIADPHTMTAETIDRMVRALNPWPGVVWQGNKILGTSLASTTNSFPLPCAERSTLFIERMQPAGSKPMSGGDYLRGHPVPSAG